jgi:hypothetical protein
MDALGDGGWICFFDLSWKWTNFQRLSFLGGTMCSAGGIVRHEICGHPAHIFQTGGLFDLQSP